MSYLRNIVWRGAHNMPTPITVWQEELDVKLSISMGFETILEFAYPHEGCEVHVMDAGSEEYADEEDAILYDFREYVDRGPLLGGEEDPYGEDCA